MATPRPAVPIACLTGLFALLLGLCSGCQKQTAAPPPAKPPEVIVSCPTSRTIIDFEETTGRLGAVTLVDVRARVSGYLDEVQFTDGADVEKDAPLFQIDARPFAAALAQAQATVQQMNSRLDRMRRQEERLVELANKKVTTAEELDLVKSQRQETEAELKAAKAAADIAKLNLEFTRIESPVAGRISRRMVDPGNLIKADDTPLATIVALDPIYAYFDIDERTVLQMKRMIAEGTLSSVDEKTIPIQISLADEEEFTHAGVVNFMDNQLSPTTGTLRLRADVQNPSKLLAPGMFVRVRVPIGESRETLMIREESLGSDQGQRFVFVVNENDEVEYRRVKTGRLYQGERVIDDGLKPEDRVIVKGLQRVRPGIKVTAKPYGEKQVAQQQAPDERSPEESQNSAKRSAAQTRVKTSSAH
ncbi:MAG: efflux RND transporter periplasmic adaptor subunit [Planctomycetaceae bacterium]